MTLEIAAFSLQDAIAAANAGADRIELCSNYNEGGITCSHEILRQARAQIQAPIFPIIRPRAGNFIYSDDEFDVMKEDIIFCKKLGFDGVVLGVLKEDKTVDIDKTRELVELAHPLPVTFHRAFDETINPFEALEDIISCRCKRILTSGQKSTAFDGKDLLKQLVESSSQRITIMPGGGIRSNHIKELKEYIVATEFHSAAITNTNSASIDIDEIERMLVAMKELK